MKARVPEEIRRKVQSLIANFENELREGDLRIKVLALIPVFNELRNLGKSLIPGEEAIGARERILSYFLKYPLTIIQGSELLVISGIQEWPRRVRELRVQFGWMIISGVTAKEMYKEDDFPLLDGDVPLMRPDHYVLIDTKQDRDAALRWNVANEIRRKRLSVRDKILEFLLANEGNPVSGEELRYVANQKTEWARRVRELRTEEGWPIVTRNTGRPDLAVGVYVLQANRQAHQHDRKIPDPVRSSVLRRDGYKCTMCGWSHDEWNPSDPRFLEIHHVKPHVEGGANFEDNLAALCNICHDDMHRRD
jgi:hypothetical protein